jgi:hypothetical protein
MSDNWLYNIKHVTPGEPVQAGVVSRPDQALTDRTDYLRSRLDAAELGRAIFDTDATIASDVLPGHAVYWNYTTKRYEKALAAVTTDQTTGAVVVQPSSECVGLCARKKSATLGDIALHGIVSIAELENATGANPPPGRYYLSAVEPGKLVRQRPAVTVSVCYVQGQQDACHPIPRVVVMPNTREFVDEHTHFRFDLFCQPAGTNTVIGDGDQQRHIITSANIDLPGWLPADHVSFRRNPADAATNTAPPGAVFGYNFSQHIALSHVWPPIPMQAVSVLWDKGANYVGATEIPLGSEGLIVCDLNGIWWMSDCYGDVPWPADMESTPPELDSTVPAECPRAESMRLSIVYLRMFTGNDRRMVTSLVPGTDSPITITNCTDLPANTGDLKLNLNLQYATPNDVRADLVSDEGLVVSGVDANGRRLQRVWVTEGIVTSGVPQIRATGTNTRDLTTEEKTALGLPPTATIPVQRGIVKFNFDVLGDKEISPQIIRLSDTIERLYLDIPYLGFPEAQASSLRIRLNVPDTELGANVQMKLRVQFFGKGNIYQQIPALTMSYRRLQKPGTTTGTALSLPTTDTNLTFDTAVSLPAYTAITRDSETFDVASGDTILVTIGRTAGDSYPEVGILRIAGVLQPGS